MTGGRRENIVRNRDRAVPKMLLLGKTFFRILVTQRECSHGFSLFYDLAPSSCSIELNILIYNVNGNNVLSSGKTL